MNLLTLVVQSSQRWGVTNSHRGESEGHITTLGIPPQLHFNLGRRLERAATGCRDVLNLHLDQLSGVLGGFFVTLCLLQQQQQCPRAYASSRQ